MDKKIWFGHSEFSLFLWWVSTVSNPQPKVLWHVSDNLMILILKAKLFNFLCNISLIPFMDMKMFNLRATSAIITSMYVTSKGKFSNQYIYIYTCKTQRQCFYSPERFSLTGSYLSLSLLMKYQNLRRTDITFSLLNPIEKAGPLETLFFRVSSQRNWLPLPSILLLLWIVLLLT